MINYLIYMGLIVTPFLVIKGYDLRYPKEIFSAAILLVIALIAIKDGIFKKFNNTWALIFIAWSFIAIIFIPKFTGLFLSGTSNMDGLWNYKTLFYLIVYFLGLVAISSADIDDIEMTYFIKVMAWCGFIMAIYNILQYFGLDQFFGVKEIQMIKGVTNYKVVGTFGQPTLTAPFVLICLPMMVYIKKWLPVLIMVIAIFCSRSDVAIASMVIGGMIYVFTQTMTGKSIGIPMAILAVLILFFLLHFESQMHLKGFIHDSGRFAVWKTAIKNLVKPFGKGSDNIFFLTGVGNFEYVFPTRNSSPFLQAHNEFIELLFYNKGFIGLCLGGMAIYSFFKDSYKYISDSKVRTFYFSVVFSVLCACGTFIWHLGAHALYSVFCVGAIYNLINRRDSNAV